MKLPECVTSRFILWAMFSIDIARAASFNLIINDDMKVNDDICDQASLVSTELDLVYS